MAVLLTWSPSPPLDGGGGQPGPASAATGTPAPTAPDPRSRSAPATGAPPRSALPPRVTGAGRGAGAVGQRGSRSFDQPRRGRPPPRIRGPEGQRRRQRQRQVERLRSGPASVALRRLLEVALDRPALAVLGWNRDRSVATEAMSSSAAHSARFGSPISGRSRLDGIRGRGRRAPPPRTHPPRPAPPPLRRRQVERPRRVPTRAARTTSPDRPAPRPSPAPPPLGRRPAGRSAPAWQRDTTVSSTRPSASVSKTSARTGPAPRGS